MGNVSRVGHQMAHAVRAGSNEARKVAHAGATAAKGAVGAAAGGVMAGRTLMQNRAAVFEKGKGLSAELQQNGMSKKEADQQVFGKLGWGVGGWAGSTQRQMAKEDIGQKIKSKFGFTSNTEANKDKTVGGIGQKNYKGERISSSMNREAAQERATAAAGDYLTNHKGNKPEQKTEGPAGSSNA